MDAKVIWHTTMSLDGFIADPDEEMDWVFSFDFGEGRTASACVERLGALLVGHRTMRVEDRQQPGFYGGAFRGPFFVLAHESEPHPPLVKGVRGAFVTGPIEEAVATVLAAAEGKDVGILGAATAAQALRAGLVDEVIVQVAPILLGEGIPLHRGGRHRFELIDDFRDGDLVTLHYRVRQAG